MGVLAPGWARSEEDREEGAQTTTENLGGLACVVGVLGVAPPFPPS
jgi:hypothetical protein